MGEIQDTRPIRIYTLGRFSLLRNGEPIRYSSKTKKPIELLKTLLAAGGREVGTAQMADILWPDADGDTAHNTLNVTLHRLRKLLHEPDAIQMADNKLALNAMHCWVDAWEFERQLNKLESLLKSRHTSPHSIFEGTAELLSLCNGPFLKSDTCKIIVATRERLQNRILHVLDSIGQHWEYSGDWGHARNLYLKGLELNPLLESLYQRLMICYREMGQRAEAMLVYQRCQEALSSNLNITPSRYTQDIRRTLVVD